MHSRCHTYIYSVQCTTYSVQHLQKVFTLSTIQEGLVCWRQLFDLMYQVDEPGSPSQAKAAHGHSKVSEIIL